MIPACCSKPGPSGSNDDVIRGEYSTLERESQMINMLENPMVMDELWDDDEEDTPWDDRDSDTLNAFCDMDMAVNIIRDWLMVTDGDEDRLLDCFERMPETTKSELIESYIEQNNMVSNYNEWCKNR